MKDLPAECCARCRFSRFDLEFKDDPVYGKVTEAELLEEMAVTQCHRRAPPIITVRDRHRDEDAVTEWQWPGVMVEDWCGEFEPKATEAA